MAMLLVDGFQFLPDAQHDLENGLYLWRCVKSQCNARFLANGLREMILNHPENNLVHNHLLSRTKMVKTLVFEEIGKFLARRGYAVSDALIREHALKYLDQAFGTTLNLNEMRSVKSAIIKFSHITKAQLKRASTTTVEETDRGKKRKKEDLFQWDESEDGVKENEIESILNISDDSEDSGDMLNSTDDDNKAVDYCTQLAPAKPENSYPGGYDAVVSSSYQLPPVPPTLLLDHHQLHLEPQRYVYLPQQQQQQVPLPVQEEAVVSSASYPQEQQLHHQSSSNSEEDEDEKFFRNLLPMFQALPPKDKLMLKAQFLQLVQWKLKSVL